MKLTAEVLLAFSEVYLKKNFDEPVETPKCHLEWWDLVCSSRRFVAIAAPRGHAKSTAITHVFGLACICFKVKRHILIISDTETQAALFLGSIKLELEENEELRQTFGVKRFRKDSETELIIEFDDRSLTRVIARGAQQKIRGAKWGSKRPDLVIGDDLENDEAVENPDRRDKFRYWFLKTLIPLMGKKCSFRIVGTILHEDSLLNRLMPNKMEDKGVVYTDLKMWTETPRAWLSVIYRAHPDFDDFSAILWPEQWGEEELKEIRQAFIDDNYPDGYAQEYLNNPVATAESYFDPNDLLPILPAEKSGEHKQPEHFYIGVDLAISTKDRRAYSAFVVAGLASDGVLRVREIVRRRLETYDIIDTMFRLHAKYKRYSAMQEEPIFLIEKENIAKAIGPVLLKEMEERASFISIEEMPPILDKRQRARPMQARIRAHMVEFDHDADWWPAFLHEMTLFDRGTFSDQVDALAWIGHHLARLSEAPTVDEIMDAEWEEEYAEASADWWDSRDSLTGY